MAKTTGFRTDEYNGEFTVVAQVLNTVVSATGMGSATTDVVLYKGRDNALRLAAEKEARESMFVTPIEMPLPAGADFVAFRPKVI